MRRILAVPALLILALLCSCGRSEGSMSQPLRHGRYAGIGVFDAGRLWSKMTVPAKAATPQTATTADDEHVVVVVDTDTGEVRECGDHSGYCTAMNPWTQAIAPQQRMPVSVTIHGADLDEGSSATSEPGR